jgi:nucleoside-diphosphate-sugar epimerase
MNMYGVSKCFGEAVAAQFGRAEGLSSIAIRIGAYEPPWTANDLTVLNLSAFLSARDMNQLLVKCVETPDIDFAIVHGISNNRIKRLDLRETQSLLGYQPQDDGFAIFGVDESRR